jgi:thiosulfate reductase cytochrome b subunit
MAWPEELQRSCSESPPRCIKRSGPVPSFAPTLSDMKNHYAVWLVANEGPVSRPRSHPSWVRICHWLVVASYLTLAVSGFLILMVHPRLYIGEVGNDLTPAFLTLPISSNHRPSELHPTVAFSELPSRPISADRNYAIFNQNGWARSLHFLAAWVFVVVGVIYLAIGIATGHIVRDLLPRIRELAPSAVWQDLKNHLRINFESSRARPAYNLLQKLAYTSVLFIVLPVMIATGLTMSPAMTSAYPLLLDLFGGYQSARTVHFFGFAALVLFFIVHVAMVIATGFRKQLRAMTWGK